MATIVIWTVALCCPAYCTRGIGCDYGYELLIVGWGGLLAGFGYLQLLGWDAISRGTYLGAFGWYANVFLLLNVIRMVRNRPPNFWLLSLGVLLALPTLHPLYPGVFDYDHDVMGMTEPRVGAFIWAASFVPSIMVTLWFLAEHLFPLWRPVQTPPS